MAHLGLTEQEMQEEYIGDRGDAFDQLILSLLRKGKLTKTLIGKVFDKNLFSQIFTHPSISEDNYEYYEFLGDLVVNKSIGQYLTRRFPQLRCPQGVRVLTRLKINLVSKKVLAEFAESLGFWDYISATQEYRMTKKKPMLEDCFEAFMGALEQQIDEVCCKPDKAGRFTSGGGYKICYNIIQNVLDSYPICGGLPNEHGVQDGKLKYEELVDPKTRLKELFDKHRDTIGKVKYASTREEQLCHTEVYADFSKMTTRSMMPGMSKLTLGHGTAALQADSQQAAAKEALIFLKNRGFSRLPPAHYAMFCV
jgi:dsRNA-specific ribonuclease